MPTRLLREGILDSERVCSLTFPAEVFYRRLMSAVDDFGRFDGRTSVLRSRLYPLQTDKVREADIERWIAECVKSGLIALYSVSGKAYILFRNLGAPRAKASKYPDPPPAVAKLHLQTDENICEQTKASAPYLYSGADSDSDSELATAEPPPDSQDPVVDPPKKDKRPPRGRSDPNPHRESMDAFSARWKAKYGSVYPIDHGKHGAFLKWMLEQVAGDPVRLAAVFDRFLADDHSFYAADSRHDFAKLRQHFPRWFVEGTPNANRNAAGGGRDHFRSDADTSAGKYTRESYDRRAAERAAAAGKPAAVDPPDGPRPAEPSPGESGEPEHQIPF